MDVVQTAGHYVTWGVVSISVTNLLVIVAMLLVFALALLVPFPQDAGDDRDRVRDEDPR